MMKMTLEEFKRRYPEHCKQLKAQHRRQFENGTLTADSLLTEDELSTQVKKRALHLARVEPKKLTDEQKSVIQEVEDEAKEVRVRAKALAGLRNK